MKFEGIWTALVTPFKKDGSLDKDAFEKLLNRQIKAGVQGVVPCGTTGETPTLTENEKKWEIETTVEICKGTDTKVLAGTGSNNTQASVEFSKWANGIGVDGVLLVTPYYNKPSQKGIENHFRTIVDAITCDAVLYNVPARTVVSIMPETAKRLSDHPRISAYKEASGSPSFFTQMTQALQGKPIDILTGDDPSFLASLAIGGSGNVSVVSNVIPEKMVEMWRSFVDGNAAHTKTINHDFFPLFRDLFIEPNPVPVKFALNRLGLCEPTVRAPLCEMEPENCDVVLKTLKATGVLS